MNYLNIPPIKAMINIRSGTPMRIPQPHSMRLHPVFWTCCAFIIISYGASMRHHTVQQRAGIIQASDEKGEPG